MRRVGNTWRMYQHTAEQLDAGVPMRRLLYVNLEDERLTVAAAALRSIVRRLLANPAGRFTANALHRDLAAQGHAIGKDTVHALLSHVEDAHLVDTVPLWTPSDARRAPRAARRHARARRDRCYARDPLRRRYGRARRGYGGRRFGMALAPRRGAERDLTPRPTPDAAYNGRRPHRPRNAAAPYSPYPANTREYAQSSTSVSPWHVGWAHSTSSAQGWSRLTDQMLSMPRPTSSAKASVSPAS